ncbi:MAG: heat-inducible transcriptional repressor HrcA [bacterium]
MDDLGTRKEKILHSIIDDYVETAHPVGSRMISRRYMVGISPATIRNEMADLEEGGYLAQPHTSAGRIPSDKGYRYYVDNMLEVPELSHENIHLIKERFKKLGNDIEEVLHQSLKLLANLTDCAAVALSPSMQRVAVKIIQMILLNIKQVLIVLVTNTGKIDNMLLPHPEVDISQDDLNKTSNLLTNKLQGSTFDSISEQMIREIIKEIPGYKILIKDTISLIKQSLKISSEDKLWATGLPNIAKQPEFHDIEKMKLVLEILEQEKMLSKMLRDESNEYIHIGAENSMPQMKDCSMVSAVYEIDNQPAGSFSVIGPTRMNYGKVLGIIRSIAKNLSARLSRW